MKRHYVSEVSKGKNGWEYSVGDNDSMGGGFGIFFVAKSQDGFKTEDEAFKAGRDEAFKLNHPDS